VPTFFLITALLLPPVLPQGTSVVFAMLAALAAALYVRSRPKTDVMEFGWPLLPLAVPLLYGASYPLPAWLRDVALFSKPVLVMFTALMFGHVIAASRGQGAVERVALIGAIATAVVYILFGVHGRTDTEALINFEPLWNRGGFYVWTPVLLMVGLRFLIKEKLTVLHYVCGGLLGMGALLSQSRSLILAMIIGMLVALARSRMRRVKPFRLALVAALLASIAAATIVARYEATPNIGEVNEMEFSAADVGDENQRWRGFEAYMAAQKWEGGNWFEKAFGHGFGSQIELGMSFFLAGRYYDAIPQSHNGYATLLVKTGVVGIASFLLFYLSLIVVSWRTAGIAPRESKPAVLAALAAASMIPIMAYTIEGATSPGSFDPTLTYIGMMIGANTLRIRRWRPQPASSPPPPV
jgi:hypothetical protein